MIAKWFTNLHTPIARLLIIAAITYFFLSIFTYHPDNKLVLFWASLGGYKLLNIWEVTQFNYPPAHYVIDKLLYVLAQPIAGAGYLEWLNTPNDQDQFVPQLARFALATKFGLILFALFSGYLIYLVARQLGTPKQALAATALWLFNPITLYSIPIMGQNDVLAICFFLLGWLVLIKRKVLATLFFGIGTAIKMIPLIWVPFLLVTTTRTNWKQNIAIVAGSGLIYLATLLPFMNSANFQHNVLSGNLNDRFLYTQLSLGFQTEAINIAPLLLMLLLVGVFTKSITASNRLSLPAFTLMILNMLMLSFTHFHPQWWTWVACFWALWIVTVDAKKVGVAIGASIMSFFAWLAIVVLFKDTALSWGLLLPLNPNLANLPTIVSILAARGIKTEQLVNLAYTWLAGTAISGLILIYTSELPAVHEKLALPKKLSAFWNWITSSKLRRATAFFLTLMTGALLLSVAAHSIPAPRTNKLPATLYYRPLIGVVQTTITPAYDAFNRFELYLSNPELSSAGTFSVRLSQGEVTIFHQEIAAQNIGEWSMLRFDIPPQQNARSTKYTIAISPTGLPTEWAEKALYNKISVGSTNQTDPENSLAVKQFVAPDRSQSLLAQSLAALGGIFWQVIVLAITLLFLIVWLV